MRTARVKFADLQPVTYNRAMDRIAEVSTARRRARCMYRHTGRMTADAARGEPAQPITAAHPRKTSTANSANRPRSSPTADRHPSGLSLLRSRYRKLRELGQARVGVLILDTATDPLSRRILRKTRTCKRANDSGLLFTSAESLPEIRRSPAPVADHGLPSSRRLHSCRVVTANPAKSECGRAGGWSMAKIALREWLATGRIHLCKASTAKSQVTGKTGIYPSRELRENRAVWRPR